ncbi:MAG: VOC family protein [bacterium]
MIGMPIWRELMTTDLDASSTFYAEMFGWNVRVMRCDYLTMAHDTEAFAGAMPCPDGGRPQWVLYIHVEDVDAVLNRAIDAGGTVCVPAFDMPHIGRIGMFLDPFGAMTAVMTPVEADAKPIARPKVHEFCWQTLLTPDARAAADFYGHVLGWTTKRFGDSAPLFAQGDHVLAEIAQLPSNSPAKPQWTMSIAVADCGEAVNHALQLGSELVRRDDDKQVGSIAIIRDNCGATVALFQPNVDGIDELMAGG